MSKKNTLKNVKELESNNSNIMTNQILNQPDTQNKDMAKNTNIANTNKNENNNVEKNKNISKNQTKNITQNENKIQQKNQHSEEKNAIKNTNTDQNIINENTTIKKSDEKIQKNTSENQTTKNESTVENGSTFHPMQTKNSNYTKPEIIGLSLIIFAIILLIIFIVFTLINLNNDKIINGVTILGIDVSKQSKEDAIQTVTNYISKNIPEEIKLKHNDYETSIASESLSISFDIEKAVNQAYDIGRSGNILQNNLEVLKTLFNPVDITADLSLDEEQLKASLNDISSKLPDTIIQSSYYIEDNNLILTKGRTGFVVNVDEMANDLITRIQNLEVNNNQIELITEEQSPNPLDIDAIHNEIYKQATDAYFTQDPYAVYPSENGLDFAISVDEAKAILEQEQEEYIIPLQVLYPNVTTNMIGQEAFPDLLSSFKTYYSTRDTDRTTNLLLASNKINGTVVMPGEVFSYNTVVGERTIAAGYKEAPIYVSGEVVDGLGGGICQVTSTLYNAVVYANLEIVERSNHQFVPSYVTASRDATVVYGSIDFKFKNNRNYPIKIMCSVSNGVVNFEIYGLKTADDYEVEISSRITSQTANYTNSEAYKILKKNGQVVSTTLLSMDTYKRQKEKKTTSDDRDRPFCPADKTACPYHPRLFFILHR